MHPSLQDLEVAADFTITNGVTCLLEALKKRNYVKVFILFCFYYILFCQFLIFLLPWGYLCNCLTPPPQVQIPGLEELQVFVPCGLMNQRPVILQLLNAAAGKDCSKEPDEIAEDEAYLLMSKHKAGDSTTDSDWAQWDGELLKLVPQMETVDTLRAMKVCGISKFSLRASVCVCLFVPDVYVSHNGLICFQVENMLLIVMQSAHLVVQRKVFQQSMEDVLTPNREQTSSQPLIAGALEELKVLI